MNAPGISLYKRNGIYYISFYDEAGRRKQKTTRCRHRREAVLVLSEFTKFLSDKRKSRNISVSSFAKDFQQYADSNLSRSTAEIYHRTLRDFVRIIGDMDITKITPKHWDTFKTCRMNERVCLRRKYDAPEEALAAASEQKIISAASVNVALRHLKAAMSTAARWQLVTKNPFEKLPLVSIPKTTPPFLTVEDAERLLSSIKEEWLRDFVIFSINTGMRRGEILSLRWADIDFENRVARITNRQGFKTKTGEQRVVSLNDAALLVLKRRQATKTLEYIFTDADGRHLLKHRITHAFKAAIRATGLPEGLHLHSTRHSFASILVGGGTSLFTVSKLLGHSNAKTSEIYSHLLPQHLQNEVDKINIGISSNPRKN